MQAVIAAGATHLSNSVPPALLVQAKGAYIDALRHVFVVSVCLSCIAVLGASGVAWKSGKKKQKPQPAAESARRGWEV